MRKKSTKERGEYKTKISNALLKSENIRELILGDSAAELNKDTLADFKKHVKSHLFIDDTIRDMSTFIFYDVTAPNIMPQTKTLNVIMYAICHRDILETYSKEGYYGNRADILSEMIEEVMTDKNIVNEFGIGEIQLTDIDIYNSTTFYGCIMVFTVKNFR